MHLLEIIPTAETDPQALADFEQFAVVILGKGIVRAKDTPNFIANRIGLFAALRTGSGEAVQSLFPVFFVFLFLSSMSLPRNLIQTDWFREVATYNPVSYLIEAIRSLLVKGWDGEALGLGFGIAATVAAIAMVAASAALKTRMVRT